MKHYVIVGNGAAGTNAADQLRRLDAEAKICMITEEAFPFYSRIRLIDYIAGDIPKEALVINKDQWYLNRDIELRLGVRVASVDSANKRVLTGQNEAFSYDRLLLATGAHSFMPNISGMEKRGVFTLRNIEDAEAIRSFADSAQHVVMIGGGLLGLETGNALRRLGKKVAVVEFFPRLLPRQLDVPAADLLAGTMTKMGFSLYLGRKTKEIVGSNQVKGVALESGETLPADMVVVSAGVRPNMELAASLKLRCNKGIEVDEGMRASSPDIYAAGDVAEFKGVLYGIWPAAMEQGKIAGSNMAGVNAAYEGTTASNQLKVAGIDLAAAGNIDPECASESRTFQEDRVYRKFVFEDNRLVGCILQGDTRGFQAMLRLIRQKQDVSEYKDDMALKDFDFNAI